MGAYRPIGVLGLDPDLEPEPYAKVLDSYVGHYNGERPHRGLSLDIPAPPPDDCRDGDTDDGEAIERTDILGGLIHEYHRAA